MLRIILSTERGILVIQLSAEGRARIHEIDLRLAASSSPRPILPREDRDRRTIQTTVCCSHRLLASRKPQVRFFAPGASLNRFAVRQIFSLAFEEPPRNTLKGLAGICQAVPFTEAP